MGERFRKFACWVADGTGSPAAFLTGLFVIVTWAVSGPIFHFSDTWQLVINTGTTIVTFLMVFLIQNTQNRDARTMQLKLDELLRAVREARTELVDLENDPDEVVQKVKEEFDDLKRHVQTRLPAQPHATQAPEETKSSPAADAVTSGD